MAGHRWWQRGIVYQVYPRSFQDSDGDGIGDLAGIEQRLDYLQWLGVDALWISPIYPSPMADFGYDVADYTDIHPLFGTLETFDRLLAEAHERGLRVLLDFVPNHTSDRHPWFQSSRSSRHDPKRDWYLWRDPAPHGGPPNNWLSVFGGPGWEWDGSTGQYYYHAFLREQPDLNWRNPDVQQAMLAAMRFWLERGVDGFRVDVMWHLIKDAELRDNPPNPAWHPEEAPYNRLVPAYSTDQPEVHGIVRMMRALVDEFDDRVLIGEIYLPVDKLVLYYGENGSGAHLPFNFQLVVLPWRAPDIYAAVSAYEASLPPDGWPNWVLGNHDNRRIASRVGVAQARVAAVLLLTLRGTPTMYYGDELGMQDVPIALEDVRDPQGINLGDARFSRDPARTPMQWTAGPGAGFTTGTPWLPLAGDYREHNVAAEREDPASMLRLCRRLIDLRRREPALSVGDYIPAGLADDVLAYVRAAGRRRFLVAMNLGHALGLLEPERVACCGQVVLSTIAETEGTRVDGRLELQADEALIVELDR
jgi:alpha-glucosidase